MSDDAPSDDPVIVWQKIETSPLSSTYLVELHGLARSVAALTDEVFSSSPAPAGDGGSYIRVDHDLHATIYRALNEAARIRGLLVAPAQKRRDQSPLAFEVRKLRTRWLLGLLEGLDLPAILNAQARHSLEHFDERLDRAGIQGVLGEIPVPTVFLHDLTLGRAGTFDQFAARMGAHQHELRVYLAEERTFVNAGDRVDLGALHREAAAVRDRLAAYVPKDAGAPDQGSSMAFVARW